MATGGADDIGMLWTVRHPSEGTGDDSQRARLEMLVRGNVAPQSESTRRWNSLGFLQGHREYVTACAFRSDGVLLATASRDCTVMLWRMPRHFSHSRVSHHLFKCIDRLVCKSEIASLGFGYHSCMSILWAGSYMGEVYSWETQTILPCVQDLGPDDLASPLKGSDCKSPDGVAFVRLNSQRAPRPRSNSDWSRMSTPHDLVSAAHGKVHKDPFQFATVDPWDTRVCRAASLQVGAGARAGKSDGLKSSMKAGATVQDEELLDKALRLMSRTVQLIFAEEPLMASAVELDGSGLLAMIESAAKAGEGGPLDARQCVDAVGRLKEKLHPLIVRGELARRFPSAKRGRKNEEAMLFRREEIEMLLGHCSEQDGSHQPTKKASRLQKLPPIERNEHGLALAHSLVDHRPAVRLLKSRLR